MEDAPQHIRGPGTKDYEDELAGASSSDPAVRFVTAEVSSMRGKILEIEREMFLERNLLCSISGANYTWQSSCF